MFENRRKTAKPTLVVLAAVLCLSGQLLSALHEAAARHVRCDEHGEVTHLRGATGTDGLGQSPRDTALTAVADGQAEHEHCGFVACFQRKQPAPVLVVAAAPTTAPPRGPAPAPALKSQTERILLSAPKIAPPC